MRQATDETGQQVSSIRLLEDLAAATLEDPWAESCCLMTLPYSKKTNTGANCRTTTTFLGKRIVFLRFKTSFLYDISYHKLLLQSHIGGFSYGLREPMAFPTQDIGCSSPQEDVLHFPVCRKVGRCGAQRWLRHLPGSTDTVAARGFDASSIWKSKEILRSSLRTSWVFEVSFWGLSPGMNLLQTSRMTAAAILITGKPGSKACCFPEFSWKIWLLLDGPTDEFRRMLKRRMERQRKVWRAARGTDILVLASWEGLFFLFF